MKYISNSEQDTIEFAKNLSKKFCGGEIITLNGDLGAGKTVFAKGIAKGLDITDTVVSPTFTILHNYEGRLKLFHFDLYRISSAEELYETGFEEAIFGGGVSVIEWAENVKEALPEKIIKIEIKKIDDNKREITVENL